MQLNVINMSWIAVWEKQLYKLFYIYIYYINFGHVCMYLNFRNNKKIYLIEIEYNILYIHTSYGIDSKRMP